MITIKKSSSEGAERSLRRLCKKEKSPWLCCRHHIHGRLKEPDKRPKRQLLRMFAATNSAMPCVEQPIKTRHLSRTFRYGKLTAAGQLAWQAWARSRGLCTYPPLRGVQIMRSTGAVTVTETSIVSAYIILFWVGVAIHFEPQQYPNRDGRRNYCACELVLVRVGVYSVSRCVFRLG